MSNNSNRTNVPEAKEAMDRFKMVKKMIEAQERQMAGK